MAATGSVGMNEHCENSENLDLRRAQVTGKLQKRDEERLIDLQKRKEEKDTASAANETSDYFTQHFAEAMQQIDSSLAGTSVVEKTKLTDHFDSLTESLHKAQKFLSDSTLFLPPYEVQRAQEKIHKIQVAIQEKREEYLPKKKFAFKSKKKVNDKPVEPASDTVQGKQEKKTFEVQLNGTNISDMSQQQFAKNPEEVNNKDVALARLTDCVVRLYGSPSAVHINKLVNCTVFSGPISGSVLLEDCSNCTFLLPCQQLRAHTTVDSEFYLHVTSRAIIEDCSRLGFAPYNWDYNELSEHYKISGLDRQRNSWDDVDDFNWLASDTPSPNWSVIPEEKRIKKWDV